VVFASGSTVPTPPLTAAQQELVLSLIHICLASIAGKAGLIGELLGVDKDDVTLGSFVFDANSVEVPGEMPWGVKQQTARHLLPGGVVVIQSMGADLSLIHI